MQKAKKSYWNRFQCYSLEDWQDYLLKYPKWQKRTAIEMLEELGSEACSFYKSFRYWVGEIYPRKIEKEIIGILFPARIYDYSNQNNDARKGYRKFDFHTLKQWLAYKNNHSEWNGKSSTEMINAKGEASSFYFRFYNWLKENYSREKRLKILIEVFPRKNIQKNRFTETA